MTCCLLVQVCWVNSTDSRRMFCSLAVCLALVLRKQAAHCCGFVLQATEQDRHLRSDGQQIHKHLHGRYMRTAHSRHSWFLMLQQLA
jgi:hypothetical protein